ncbi:hypothetical protein [Vulcanisaeta sp. JCM 16159]|uniref:hypothetical protein n=1 Tax=Vulcanisaeta sp. JCM 16159 TaxID=1295371 RepID=UPI001FB557C3|nr:hypothetical protein [Vulcanisaeta sp. JCM 16159]
MYPLDMHTYFVNEFKYLRDEVGFSNGVPKPGRWFTRVICPVVHDYPLHVNPLKL